MKQHTFERMAVSFIVQAAKYGPDAMKSLVFSSPLCARITCNNLLWHAGYRNNNRIFMFCRCLFGVVISTIKGLIKIIVFRAALNYRIYGKIKKTLLVAPVTLGGIHNDSFSTSYIVSDRDDCVFVFGWKKEFFGNATSDVKIPLKDKLAICNSLLVSGIKAFNCVWGSHYEKSLLLLMWLSWVMSLRWMREYCLEQKLLALVAEYNIEKIGCLHEMHPHARIVWRVAARCGIKSYALQHAEITEGKRWYFFYPEEKIVGLALPDVMYVFSERIERMLRGAYNETVFRLGCSNRYADWKILKDVDMPMGKYWLFVSALPLFDNECVIEGARKVLEIEKTNFPVRIRLHPYAKLNLKTRMTLRRLANKGLIHISSEINLRDDIKGASVVVGCGSTTMLEALICGRPVVKLDFPGYFNYADISDINGVWSVNYANLCSRDIVDAMKIVVDRKEALNRLGVSNPIVTYNSLFAH